MIRRMQVIIIIMIKLASNDNNTDHSINDTINTTHNTGDINNAGTNKTNINNNNKH
jgi:hypothetical protein